MPVVNGLPTSGSAEAYSRVLPTPVSDAGNAGNDVGAAANTVPAGAGPAAVVQISEAARSPNRDGGNAGLEKPGLNNTTMAAEGGDAGRLRALLAERYEAQNARLNEPAT